MINYYEFIDGKPGSGLKERVLGPTVFLYNKLSADETNNIRAKLNELVDVANFISIPLFSEYGLKLKGDGNTNLTVLEAGDIAHRYFDNGTNAIEELARFNGGDPGDPASYTPISGKPDPDLQFATVDGPNQVFILPDGFIAGSVLVSRGEIFKDTEWEQNGNELTILIDIYTGNSIYTKPN